MPSDTSQASSAQSNSIGSQVSSAQNNSIGSGSQTDPSYDKYEVENLTWAKDNFSKWYISLKNYWQNLV